MSAMGYSFSKTQLNTFIKENVAQKRTINKIVANKYWDRYENSLTKRITTSLEKKIVILIENYVSIPFIAREFNLSIKQIKIIAEKNKCSSNLLINEKENRNERLFTKLQIVRASEEFNFICPMCFKTLDVIKINTITGHHINPFARNGETTLSNCLPLHVACHFDNFKLLHRALFDIDNTIYSVRYFNLLKQKLRDLPSGVKDFSL
ncbi:MAG: HNH endonuclease [Rickettsiales bacterium]|jgi:hypothetical protein|nr:HNH endonuclease [Rickettsiales bacterium]